MKQPKIELKSCEVHVGLSEETPAYTAKLLVDGVYFADVSNQGHGGCDMVYPPKGTKPNDTKFYEKLKELEARIAETYPKHDMSQYKMDPMNESLEGLCHGLVWDFVDQRNFRSQLSRKVLVHRDGKLYDLKGKRSEALINAACAHYGADNVLNKMPFQKAWEMAKSLTA